MIDPTGSAAGRFPLVARPRPPCTPLPDRVADLHARAVTAARAHDPAAATAVFNLAALLASDCGLPELARTWSHQLARTALHHHANPRHALEPLVNLARLRTRAADGLGAWSLLETLYHAVATRTDITIDGIDIPTVNLTSTPDTHRELRTWLWAILLSSGAHALASAGRWNDARHRLEQYNGIGNRMLDGRQIAVLADATAGRHDAALKLLHNTQPGDPAEQAVTTCLTLLCQPGRDDAARIAANNAYQGLNPAPGLAVFHGRLGLSLIDALGGATQAEAPPILRNLLRHAMDDGYAARDLLAHPGCRAAATDDQRRRLTALVADCGLDARTIPPELLAIIHSSLEKVGAVIGRDPTTASGLFACPPRHKTLTEDQKIASTSMINR